MATGSRSSKCKSSPPLKKKRRTNKDRSKKRSKLGKGKSKDSYSDDESLSVASSMSYSSTDSGRGRSRSRTIKDASKRRKKSRLRSESSEDDGAGRRNKRSKKSRDRDAKKKQRPKRKRRREPSVSCSDDSEGERERTEKRRGRRRRDLDEDRLRRSDSSFRLELDGCDGSYRSEEKGPEESNPRRLRSIIIFAKEHEEADKEILDRDGHKEEIIYDHDDYPSPRSNESNDGDAKRKPCTGRAGRLEDQHGEMVASKVGITELSERCDLGVNVMARDVNAYGFSAGDSLEEPKTNVSSTDAGSNNTDLEAVLRQKALENLRKFKGVLRAKAKKPVSTKSSNEGEVKQSSSLNDDVEGKKKDLEASAGGVGVFSVPRKNISTVGQQHSCRTIQKSSSLKRPATESSQTLPQDSKVVRPSEEGSADDVGRSEGGEVGVLALKEKHLGASKFAKQALPTQQLPVLNTAITDSLPLPSKTANALTDSVDDVNDKHKKGALTLRQRLGPKKLDRQLTPILESSEPMPEPAQNKDTIETGQSSHDTKHKKGAVTLRQRLGPSKLDRQLPPIPESSVPMSEPAQNKDTIEPGQFSHDTKIVTDDVEKTIAGLSTPDAPNLEGECSNAKENKEGDSQFQQKTMSVMRGGELVQVNYKVYIPKNAKALARRKLRR